MIGFGLKGYCPSRPAALLQRGGFSTEKGDRMEVPIVFGILVFAGYSLYKRRTR